VTIRVLADREPYPELEAGLESESRDFFGTMGPSGPVRVLNGPATVDELPPDILVLPAETFLVLRRLSAPGQTDSSLYVAYGPLALMQESFQRGCSDYIREPWSLTELRARLGRLLTLRFLAGGKRFELSGSRLACGGASVELCEGERALLRSLLLNAPLPVPRSSDPALGRHVSSLRRKMDEVEPGLGLRIQAIRAFGYRLDGSACV
jgi:hypothetical protein